MNKVIYLSMVAADQMLSSQNIHANNLSNANTNAFKNELEYFTNAPIKGPGMQVANRPYVQNTYSDLTPGALISTGRDLDVAVQGDGWFVVQTADGSEAYTRSGNFETTPEGLLQTRGGNIVQGSNGEIVIPSNQKIMFASDGTVSVVPIGQSNAPMVTLGSLRLVTLDPKNLVKGPDGLFRTRDQSQPEIDPNVRVAQGFVEGSNVNTVDEMINMMQMARGFELQMKLMKSAEENDQAAANLIKLQ